VEELNMTEYKYYTGTSIKATTGLVAAYNMIPTRGQVLDISGNGRHGTITACHSTKDGLRTEGNGSKSSILFNPAIFNNATVWSVCSRIKDYVVDNIDFLFGGVSNRNIMLSRVSGYARVAFRASDAAYHHFDVPSTDLEGKDVSLCFVANGTTITCYVNGVNRGLVTPATTEFYLNNIIRGISIDVYTPLITLCDFRAYERTLSDQEIKDYHNSFVKPTLVETFKDQPVGSKKPREWEVTSGGVEVKEHNIDSKELITNGGFDIDFDWNKGPGWSINNGKAIYNAAQSTFSNLTQLSIGSTLNKMYKISFDCISNAAGEGLKMESSNGFCLSYSFESDQPLIAGKRYVAYLYSVGANDNLIFRTRDKSSSGTLEIDNVSVVEVEPLPDFKQGTKYLETTAAGTTSTPSKTAYGVWEWDFYSVPGRQYFTFINDTREGYASSFGDKYAFINYDNNINYLVRRAGGTPTVLAQTATNYTQDNTWYRVKIIRDSSGKFTVLLKGGNLTPTAGYDGWNLMPTDVGTNPVTDNDFKISNYFVSQQPTGEAKFTNLKIYNGVKQ
jgi:hypothetical protein